MLNSKNKDKDTGVGKVNIIFCQAYQIGMSIPSVIEVKTVIAAASPNQVHQDNSTKEGESV